jgi:pyruvate,water dikinase
MLIVTDKSTPHYAQKESGGKGANLYWLTRAGLQVPRWYVIGKSFFEDFLTHQNLQQKLDFILQENDKDPKQASALIEDLFCQTPLPEKTREILVKSYQEFDCHLIAVRSSAADEDSSSHSFAGQLSSYLYVKTEAQYLESIVKCWASAYTERSLIYRQQNNLDKSQIKVAVVIQQMIDPEVSGVAFTCDPLNGSPTTMTINAVYGVGEGLVSGLLDADTYVVDKETKNVLEQEIVTKEKKLELDPEKEGPRESAVEKDLQERSSLDEDQLKKLAEILLKIENEYHYPQDIEWAYKDGEFTILQSRPVTTQVQTGLGTLFIWDNSNIVESYGGLTMPLTFGFARYVYHQVYVQFCEILMVPWKHIREMDFVLQNMLGLFYGRVYYNLLNWYKLTSILPGYKFNKNFTLWLGPQVKKFCSQPKICHRKF